MQTIASDARSATLAAYSVVVSAISVEARTPSVTP